MDPTVESTINSLIDAFAQYKITNANLQAEVDAFCTKLRDFAQSNNDAASFFAVYTDSGIPEEYSALVTKVAMASMGTAQEDSTPITDYSDTPNNSEPDGKTQATNTPAKTEADLPSVHDFLQQYRPVYDEICKGDNPRAKAAYEAIFDVENRASDLIECQMILERERLLWNIVRDTALDNLVPTLRKMDPLFRATTAKLLGQIAIYKEAQSDEELTYKIDLQEVKDIATIADYTSKMHLTACIATELYKYLNAKDNVYEWKSDSIAQGGVNSMIKHRENVRSILALMRDYMDTTFDDILADEGLKIWLLNPRNLDETGRTKQVENPEYFDIFRDVVNNEILADISIADALIRQTTE